MLLLAACSRVGEPVSEPAVTLEPVQFSALAGWNEDDVAAALPAWRGSCVRLLSRPATENVGPQGLGGTVDAWRAICDRVVALSDDDGAVRAFVEEALRPYRVVGQGGATGLFTGYFEPRLRGSRERSGPYQVPLFALPRDHVTVDLGRFDTELAGRRIVGRVEGGRLRPYDTRGDIDTGGLADRAAVLYWVDDTLDAFVLHIQGSGQIVLPDGEVRRIGFAAHNGFAYRSVGRWLIEQQELAAHEASFAGIRRWLEANPGRTADTLAVNQRYIFFREIDGDGPIGAGDVVLTAWRSLAVDSSLLPLHVPMWLDAEAPGGQEGRLRRLMVAQDTGGAITGPVRGDVYWGTGEPALAVAGRMRSKGSYYVLLPRSLAPPVIAQTR